MAKNYQYTNNAYSHPLGQLVSLKKQELDLVVGKHSPHLLGQLADIKKRELDLAVGTVRSYMGNHQNCKRIITTIAKLPGGIMSSSIFMLREKINQQRQVKSLRIHK